MAKKQPNYCSFCGQPESNSRLLLQGISGFICDECVYRAHLMLQEQAAFKKTTEAPDFKLLKPVQIKSFLDQYVIGQDAANASWQSPYITITNALTNIRTIMRWR